MGAREGTSSSTRSNNSTPNDISTDPMNRKTSIREANMGRGVVSPTPVALTNNNNGTAATAANNATSSVTKKYDTEEADKQ